MRTDLGRWLSRDPLQTGGSASCLDCGDCASSAGTGANAYLYALANPLTTRDPTGTQNSCDNARTDECKPQPVCPRCCRPSARCLTGSVVFFIHFPQRRTPALGLLSIYIWYLEICAPDPNAGPGVHCPPPRFDLKRMSTHNVTSGAPGHYRPHHDWRHVGADPIPASWSTQEATAVDTTCHNAYKDPYVKGHEGYRFNITPEYIHKVSNWPGALTARSEFRIHPDGGLPGTGGCIASEDEGTAKRVRSCLKWAHEKGCASLALFVSRN